MALTSTLATSRRGYLSQDELEQYSNITVTDAGEADDVISQAEEMVDAFVGPQDSFLNETIEGLAAAGSTNTITLESEQQNTYDKDYFKGCEIDLVGGTGEGQRAKITGSTRAGVLTIDSNWDTQPDATTFYQIHQLGKFPRRQDTTSHTNDSVVTWYKNIPEAIRRAVAAQVEFIINQGDEFFGSDQTDKQSESIGDYSYNMGNVAAGLSRLIAPKAKLLLRGYINRKGTIEV